MSDGLELRPTIDRSWLEREAAREPLTHAFALWDLTRTPQAVRFVSALRNDRTLGYLLIWLGRRDRPVVHWYGTVREVADLIGAFPAPPFSALVPPEVEPLVLRAFPRAIGTSVKQMLRDRIALPAGSGGARRLERADRPALLEFLRTHDDAELGAYAGGDPVSEPTWGAFEEGRLVGLARAAVRLPTVWVVGGVFVDPLHRGRGHGRAVVVAVLEAAERAGAAAGLYARDEPTPAARLYDQLGFRVVGRRRLLAVEGRA